MISKLPDTGTSIFTVMSAMANEYGAINLSQGFPDFTIDTHLENAVLNALKAGHVQYAPMAGRLDLREQISNLIFQRYNLSVHPDSEITITAGATQAIFTAIATLVNPGDEVIMFDPAYDCYDPSVKVFGGIPVHLKLNHPNYSINWDEVEKKVTDKTRIIITNNPHNPCGSVWTEDDLYRLEKIVSRYKNLYVISDEVYEYIQFNKQHHTVLKNELLRSRSFFVYSFGKTLHVTGWKLGYCIAPPALTAEFRKVHQFNVFCVNNTIQAGIADYLAKHMNAASIADFYQKKRDLFLHAISNSKFKPLACHGTYFCLLDYSSISNQSDVDFAKQLIQEIGVASIPVSVFYKDQTDHHVLRFCFAKKDETLSNASEKLCSL
ncbi:MAG: aminotransferase class I/II-fold pyridoxal phosphate-dependent enzyme [Crocinitomicaceae bacterium]|nr:aminotransferase class I/II-fold pyridoxal phosphate-dependent enzyme [Crocinitomicaceae bacterium]